MFNAQDEEIRADMTQIQVSGGIFLSYTHDLRPQAQALGVQLIARGLPVLEPGSDSLPSGVESRAEIASLIRRASTFVVLVPVYGSNSHWQQFEISQILEVAWSNAQTVVGVVAPAIGAIPSALRHQQFVRYFPHDEVRLDAWLSEPVAIDRFIDDLAGPLTAEVDRPPEIDADSLRLWRNRIVHLGRTEPDFSGDDRAALLRAVQQFIIDARTRDNRPAQQDVKLLLDAANLAVALEAKDLVADIYDLIQTIDIDTQPSSSTKFELLYSRAKAALESGRPRDALSDFLSAAELNNQLRGTNNDPRTVAAVFNAAVAASRSGDLSAAEDLDRRALSMARNSLGRMHPQTAGIAVHLARLLANDGRTVEAIELLREAEAAYAHATPTGSPERAEVASELRKLNA